MAAVERFKLFRTWNRNARVDPAKQAIEQAFLKKLRANMGLTEKTEELEKAAKKRKSVTEEILEEEKDAESSFDEDDMYG